MLRSLLRVSAVVLCVCIPAAVFAQGEIRRPAERPVDPTCSSSSAPTRSALAGAVLTCTDATVYVGNGSSWTKLGSGGGSITGSDTQVLFFDGADNPAGSSLFRFVKDFFGSPVVYFTSSDVSGAYTELNIFAQDTTDHQESPNLFIAANNGTPGAGGGGMFLTGLGSNYNNVDLLNLV